MKLTENLPPIEDSDKCSTCDHEWSQHSNHGHKGGRFECLVENCKCGKFLTSKPCSICDAFHTNSEPCLIPR